MKEKFLQFSTIFFLIISTSYPRSYTQKDQFKGNLKFFEFSKKSINWNHVEKQLIETGQSTKIKYLSLDKASMQFVAKGFDTLEGVEGLYQARKRIIERVGHLLPRLSLNFGNGIPDSIQAAGGPVGFLFPANWFSWMRAKQFYDARKYTFLDLLLDRNSYLEILYYELHKKKMNYEIQNDFYKKIEIFVNDMKRNKKKYKIDPFLIYYFEGLLSEINMELYEHKREILDEIPKLSHLMGYLENWGNIDIKQLDFSIYNYMNRKYLNEEKLYKLCAKNSLELKSIRYLKKAAQYSLAVASTDFVGEVPDAQFGQFGLSFGLDNVARIQIRKSQIREINVFYKKAKSEIGAATSEIAKNYNVLIDDYHEALYHYEKSKRSVYVGLERYFKQGIVEIDLHHGLEFLFKATIRLYNIKHDFLILESMKNRFQVTAKIRKIKQYMPVKKELIKLKKWASKRGT